jgi:protein SCO1
MTASSILLAVAPKCPICFLAYFGVFGVATASTSVYRVWLPPLTAIWLTLTVILLAFQRGSQRRYGPVLLGIFAGIAVFAGKFFINNQTMVYAGILGMVGAAVWRSWSRRPASSEICSPCEITFVHDK